MRIKIKHFVIKKVQNTVIVQEKNHNHIINTGRV